MDLEREQTSVEISYQAFSRRRFVKLVSSVGGGFVLGVELVRPGGSNNAFAQGESQDPAFGLGAFVKIAPNGNITLYSKNPEIGQGIKTGFGLILAEELDARWADVTVEQAATNETLFGRQFAGGSLSTPWNWMLLRQAGAGARVMLIAAAAKQWGVPESEITTADSVVHHVSSNRSAGYGDLAEAAALIPAPDLENITLKDPKNFKLLGKRHTGVDNQKIATGQPLFGIDVSRPGMLFAVFQKCPVVYGTVKSANLDEIKKLPGVKNAFILDGTGVPAEMLSGVAIVADSTWSALAAKRKLNIVWDESNASQDSWTGFLAQSEKLTKKLVGAEVVQTIGDVDKALSQGTPVESDYTYGFVSHAPMEPQNCTAQYRKEGNNESLEIWAPTQMPGNGVRLVAGLMGIPAENITLHQQRVGGGFGRRLSNDYMVEAAFIAKQVGALPVKLLWTREDDMEHDFIRTGGSISFKASLDQQGKISAWNSHLVHFDSLGGTSVSASDWHVNEFPARHISNYRASQTKLPLKIPTGSFRAPGSNTAAWVVQSFFHELSTIAGRDHVEFLLESVEFVQAKEETQRSRRPPLDTKRAKDVIQTAAEISGWNKRTLPPGHALGCAFHFSHQGHFAEVAEVSVDADKHVTVHKVWVVGDIGPIVNLSAAENQCEGCVVDALSTMALEVTMEKGQIEQKNFHQYKLARMPNKPKIETHFLATDYPPTGVGEPAFPPLAPAVCNAIFTASEHRIRTLPITREGFSI